MSAARGIFISYRRSTSAGYAGRIRDHLSERYGGDNVFMDVDSIAPGTDFVDSIDASLNECRAVLVVIDPQWASVPNELGQPRLLNPTDWVRTEIERALIRAANDGLALVPVLVGGAEFPSQSQLPETIEALTRYNGVELRDAHFESDLDDVMTRLGGGWRRLAQLTAAGVALSALVMVLVWLAFRDTTPEVDTLDSSPMVSDLNVAVAEFTTLDESGSVEADPDFTLDVDIARELDGQLEQLDDVRFTYDIRQPENTGIVEGRTAQERAASAEALATQIDADVVIYGFRDPTSPQAITPEFYVSTRNLGDALELAGPYPMGARISDSVSLDTASRRALRLEVLARTSSLTDFVVGLVNLKAGQAGEALPWFRSAVEGVAQWETSTNSEVFHLYVGSADLQLGDVDAARAAYQNALALSPGYARAMVGLAEVEFQTARGRCVSGTTDDAGLVGALGLFDEAAALQAPASAQIGNKAALGRGRVMVCRSQAGSASDWDVARAELSSVIDAYNSGQTEIGELAALAYGARALTALRLNGSAPTAASLRDAASDLELGFALTGQERTRDSYAGLLGFVYDQLGDSAATDLWCRKTSGRCPAVFNTSATVPVANPDSEPVAEPQGEQSESDASAGLDSAVPTSDPSSAPPPVGSVSRPAPPTQVATNPPRTTRPQPPNPDTSFPDVFGDPVLPAEPPLPEDFPDVLDPALPATK